MLVWRGLIIIDYSNRLNVDSGQSEIRNLVNAGYAGVAFPLVCASFAPTTKPCVS